MKHMKDVPKTQNVLPITLNVKKPIFVLNLIGFVMEIMIVAIILMKIHYIVLKGRVHRTVLDVQTIVVYLQLGKFYDPSINHCKIKTNFAKFLRI